MPFDLNISVWEWESVILDPANGPQSGRAIVPVWQTVSPLPGFEPALEIVKAKVVEDQNQMVLHDQGESSGHLLDVHTGARSEAQVVRGDMIQRPVSPPPGFGPHASKTLNGKALLEFPTQNVKKEVTFGEASTGPGIKVYPCSKCGAIIDSAQRYASHIKSHYRNETPEARRERRAAKTKPVRLYPAAFSKGKKHSITLTSNKSDCEKINRIRC